MTVPQLTAHIALTPEMIQRYMQRRLEDLTVCKQSLQAKNSSSIEIIGHRLRGSAESFGFPELAALGTQIEELAKSEQWNDLEKTILSLEKWIHEHSHS